MRWSVVVPTCRPERVASFLAAWDDVFARHTVVVVDGESSEEVLLALRPVSSSGCASLWLDAWDTIPDWMPRRSDMIRSWGFYRSWDAGCDFVLSLDDDVRPVAGVDVFAEFERV